MTDPTTERQKFEAKYGKRPKCKEQTLDQRQLAYLWDAKLMGWMARAEQSAEAPQSVLVCEKCGHSNDLFLHLPTVAETPRPVSPSPKCTCPENYWAEDGSGPNDSTCEIDHDAPSQTDKD